MQQQGLKQLDKFASVGRIERFYTSLGRKMKINSYNKLAALVDRWRFRPEGSIRHPKDKGRTSLHYHYV